VTTHWMQRLRCDMAIPLMQLLCPNPHRPQLLSLQAMATCRTTSLLRKHNLTQRQGPAPAHALFASLQLHHLPLIAAVPTHDLPLTLTHAHVLAHSPDQSHAPLDIIAAVAVAVEAEATTDANIRAASVKSVREAEVLPLHHLALDHALVLDHTSDQSVTVSHAHGPDLLHPPHPHRHAPRHRHLDRGPGQDHVIVEGSERTEGGRRRRRSAGSVTRERRRRKRREKMIARKRKRRRNKGQKMIRARNSLHHPRHRPPQKAVTVNIGPIPVEVGTEERTEE